MNKEVIFIGPMGLGGVPKGGDTMKNQLFLERFVQVFEKIITVDTLNWRKKPWIIIQLVWIMIWHHKAKVIISANPDSADTLIRIIKKLHLQNDIFYWVVGGSFHKMIANKKFNASAYTFLKGIFVQGQSMADSLKENGLNNAYYVPNSKLINHYGVKDIKHDEIMHFVFLSRVEEYKGCTDIIKSIDILNAEGYKGKFDMVFFGRESENHEYAKAFRKMVDEHPEVEYRGLLNLKDSRNYDELAKFDVMLFPTYWHGEGFPGIVIDAYIASLPIIATDWHLNKDVIADGMTGWIIPPHDLNALASKMKYAIDNPENVCTMAKNCRKQAERYDSRVVLSENNLRNLHLI